MIPAASGLLSPLPSTVREISEDVYSALVEGSGCSADVKTIYISFTIDADLVASMHPNPTFVEVALALPEDHESQLLEDASHLTWRTLPLLVPIDEDSDREEVLDLVYEAVGRVTSGEHDVNRDPDYFRTRRREQERSRFWEVRR